MDRLKNLSLHIEPISKNLFSHVPLAPPDPILGTAIAFKNDTNKDKVNLGIGAYRDGEGKPYVFKVVKEVEEKIVKGNHNKVKIILFRNIYPLMECQNSVQVLET